MHWDHPNLLFGLWLLPAAGWLLVHAHRARAQAALRFAGAGMLPRLMPADPGWRPWVKGAATLAGLGLLIAAAARPRFGIYYEPVSLRGVDVFVLVDVSRSMLAEDVIPSRLARAKTDVRDLLPHLEGDRVGLIAFAGRPVVKTPLTTDHAFFLAALEELDPTTAPRGGTQIGDAIRKALECLDEGVDRDRVIVLITDGEDHDSYPQEAAQHAAERGVRIFTLGLGDPGDGARVPTAAPQGTRAWVKHDNREVWSRMDEALLERIALTTGGAYIPARTRTVDLGQVYEDHIAELTRGEIQAEKRKRRRDRFPLFLAGGILLMLLERGIRPYPRSEEAA